MSHQHLHKRHARAAFAWPDPKAIASAIAAPFADAFPQETVTSFVYETMSPTFAGSIAGYTTPGAPSEQPVTLSSSSTSASDADLVTVTTNLGISTPTSKPQPTSTRAESSTSTGLPSSILSPSTSIATTLPILSATVSIHSSSPSSTSTLASAVSVASSSSSVQPLDSSSSGDMTAGAKAGLAIGIILAIGAIASLLIFCIRQRRQKAQMQRLEDEKYEVDNDPFFGNRAPSTRTAKTASTAPRLSLRPVTQFLPGFVDTKPTGRPNNLYSNDVTAAVPMQSQPPPSRSAWERPINSDNQNRANPFGNHAETIDPVNAYGPSILQGAGPGAERIIAGTPAGAVTGITADAATAAPASGPAVGLARGASKRGFGPKPLDFTKTLPGVGPPSPAGTEFSMTEVPGTPVLTGGAAAIAAAGGPQNSAVHRVQLDFKPSMDDELELRAGQLIRLLHEYDDGWALCIRLDRSQQGVVPRTCLSTRPVKPRPQQNMPRGNPPPGMRVPQQQQGRSMSPGMYRGPRPASPAGQRPTTYWPQTNPQGRPGSAASNRPSVTGGPYGPQGGRSSPAPGQTPERLNSPPNMRTPYGSPPNGTGPVGRKPVPGQAM